MHHRAFLSAVCLVVIALLLATGCPKRLDTSTPARPAEEARPVDVDAGADTEGTQVITEDFPTQEVESADIVPPTVDELNRQGVLRTVYFEFDRSDLSEESRSVLRQNADWLRANGEYSIVIEGHCDERGTIEYNLSLGERRASTVREYLGSLGIPRNRMRIVSYGEERPADMGSGEAAWTRNRRAEFVIEG